MIQAAGGISGYNQPVHSFVLGLNVPDSQKISVRIAPTATVVEDVSVLVPGVVGVVLPGPDDPLPVVTQRTDQLGLPVTNLPPTIVISSSAPSSEPPIRVPVVL